jgi:hypothetical protein
MSFVRTLLRWLLTASLAAACAAQPIALDACRAACDSTRAAQVAAVPPCHHAAGSRISQPTTPCSQAHAVVPADPGISVYPPGVASACSRAPLFDDVAPRLRIADSSAGPPSIPNSVESNTPLRV